jgi:hypothetical protein
MKWVAAFDLVDFILAGGALLFVVLMLLRRI